MYTYAGGHCMYTYASSKCGLSLQNQQRNSFIPGCVPSYYINDKSVSPGYFGPY